MQLSSNTGKPTFICRIACGISIAAPYLYWWICGYSGNPYFHLFLVVLALAASVVLIVNSLYCLFRYRTRDQIPISFLFFAFSIAGIFAMPYLLPGFKM
jgi:hypothetical protein